MSKVIYDEIVPARAPWSRPVYKGQKLKIVDLEGNQAADFLIYGLANSAERYSASITMARQKNIFLKKGATLYSNEDNAMMTIIDTDVEYHDTIGGACSVESNSIRYGHFTRRQHGCVDNYLSELSKYEMGKRDIVSNINWFMNVPVEKDGTLGIVDGISSPGKYVLLQAEMDCLSLLSNCPQINNPCNAFKPTPVQILITED